MPHGGHTMLRDAAGWHTLTARLTAAFLGLGPFPAEAEGAFD